MAVDHWCVVVVRAWVEAGQPRVRMLMTGDQEGVATHGSVLDATEQLDEWLTAFVENAREDAAATQRRRPEGRS